VLKSKKKLKCHVLFEWAFTQPKVEFTTAKAVRSNFIRSHCIRSFLVRSHSSARNTGAAFILKLRCDTRFQRALTACSCVFKVITFVGANLGKFFENATACGTPTLKTRVATQL